jgi:eukaryotic-like serine/threonine-protein kinase
MTDNQDLRDPVEQLAEEYTRRLRSGEQPTIDEYAEKYPQYAGEIRELFPMVASMEKLSSREGEERQSAQSRVAVPLETDRIGDYRILREIGRGGMGVVYEAEQESLRRRVAIKLLAAAATASPAQVQRFTQEARAAAGLHHTNIVPVFGSGQEDGRHYYVMQLIEGVGLDEVLRAMARKPGDAAGPDADSRNTLVRLMTRALREGRFARKDPAETPAEGPDNSRPPGHRYWSSVARVGWQLADALQYAHRQGVIHRDIKPSNLLLDRQGAVWITDFGLAKSEDHESLTQPADVVGTVRYMAPEQFRGPADARSDIYSLGLTLYEMATLTPAFDSTSHAQLIHRKTEGAIRPPREANPNIPRDLETIILTACAPNPAHRYRTAADLAADLERFLDDRPIQARRATAPERLWRWSRRNPAIAGLGAAAIALLAIVAVVSTVGRHRADRLLEQVADEGARAQANLQLAIQAFDNIIHRVASRGVPESFDLDLGVDPASVGETPVTGADAELLQSLLAFFADFAERNKVDLRAETANAYRRIGDIRLRLGQLQEAGAAYRSALEIYEALRAKSPGDPTLVLAEARVSNASGLACSRSGDWHGAIDAHSQARQTLRQIGEAQADDATQFEMAHTLNLLASVMGRSDLASALGSLRPGAEEVLAPLGGLVRRRALLLGRAMADGDRPAAAVTSLKSRVAQADTCCRQAEQILLALAQRRPDNPDYRAELSATYRYAARIQAIEGRFPQAEESIGKAVDLLKQLVRDYPDQPQLGYRLADALCLTAPQSEMPSATERQRLVEANLMCKRLTAMFPSVPEYQSLMAGTWMKLADLQCDANEPDTAEWNYRQAAACLNTLIERSPDVLLYRLMDIRTNVRLSELKREHGQLEPALQAVDAAVSLYEGDTRSPQNVPIYRRLGRPLYLWQARILADLGRPLLASQAALKARAAGAAASPAGQDANEPPPPTPAP